MAKINKTICSHWVRCSSRTIQFQPNWIIWWWLPRWFFNIELYSWLSIDWITVHAENTHLLCKGEYHCSPEGLPWYCMEPTKAEKSIVNFHVVKLAVTLETSRHRGMVLLPMVNALWIILLFFDSRIDSRFQVQVASEHWVRRRCDVPEPVRDSPGDDEAVLTSHQLGQGEGAWRMVRAVDILLISHSHPSGFYWGHQSSWILTSANSMKVSNIKSYDHNSK